jgi:hypothetical protein
VTLSTDVYILDEVDPAEVFRFCQGLLTKYDDGRHMPPQSQQVRDEQDASYTAGTPGVWAVQPDNPWSRDNQLGQGLPAWLMTAYRPDGPLRAEDPGHDEDCDEDCTGNYHARVCWMKVDFDTAYGYKDKRGWGCGDLHAALLSELGAWLTAQGIRWEWRNEFTGDVHVGPDGLTELGGAGAEAQDWFANTVLPAVFIEQARNGGGVLNVGGRDIAVPDLSAVES